MTVIAVTNCAGTSGSQWRSIRRLYRCALLFAICASCVLVRAQATPPLTPMTYGLERCPRQASASIVAEPPAYRSTNGILQLTLTAQSSSDSYRWSDSSSPPNWSSPASISGHARFCYVDEHGSPAPTLRVQPGDALVIRLKNELALPSVRFSSGTILTAGDNRASSEADSCRSGAMNPASTNLHFHGLSVPPVCHQDDTLNTVIQPGDAAFEYRIQIPKNQPPGLYWYHPHLHGLTEEQLLGGASGVLIVEGIEQAVPSVAGLPERVFVLRDERMPNPTDSEKNDPNRPTKQLSINYVPVPYPKYPPAVIKMKPSERQLWRVLNASADTYLDLMLLYNGKRQSLSLVAVDGVPLHYGEPGAQDYVPQYSDIFLPPGSRAEFVVTGPPTGVLGLLVTNGVSRGAEGNRGPIVQKDLPRPALHPGVDDVDPPRPLATVIASAEASTPALIEPASTRTPDSNAALLSSVRPVRQRRLYFSEMLIHPDDPRSPTLFFITEEGHTPAVFDPHSIDPSITVRQGDVEDWTIENRSQEPHVFHVHQLHFLVVGSQGSGWQEPTLRDTVNLPAWDGFRKYPKVTIRMDFRDPQIVGTFPFHCHIAQHSDGGMMGTVRVEPALKEGRIH
jgi:FtsP/CotA-like multicopper oxidase with cupredoxin domain